MIDPLIEQGVALITGAGSGIGQSTAEAFATAGCKKVFLVDLSEKGLKETEEIVKKANPTTQITLYTADVGKEESVKAMVHDCVKTYGRIDFACNNAGIAMSNISTTETDLATFEKVHDVNFRGLFYCQKHEITVMLKQEPLKGKRTARGSIVNTASLSGIGSIGGLSPYHSTKHGVVIMTRIASREYGEHGIRVNCICPGFVETPLMMTSNLTQEFLDACAQQCPMGRLIKPDEIADGYMFLHGSLASSVTGIALSIDGGAQLYHTI